MLDLKEDSPLMMLRQFAVHFDADLQEGLGAASMSLSNKRGEGIIKLYELFPGLTAWVYDIEFNEDFIIDMTFAKDKPYYFGYPLEGVQYQKFPNDKEYQTINQGQNFIIVSEPGTKSEFKIPSGKLFKCCYLIINPKRFQDSTANLKTQLQVDLNDIFQDISEKRPYRYFGDVDVRTGLFVEIIVKNNRTDLVGRLLTEGAVLNMLASQIHAHDHDKNTESFQPDLSIEELNKLSDIGDYVKANLGKKLSIADISYHTGLPPKKLQLGFKFLFGYSVNQYISNIRLERAKELIYTTDKTISEICFQVGYSSRSYLSKVFFERYGVLPSDYKSSFIKNNLVFEVSYRSMAKSELTEKDIEAILQASRENNNNFNITGSLIYHRNVFFQIIEGSKADVLKLYDKIKSDKRHFDVQTLWQGVKKTRDFEEWDMAVLTDESLLNIKAQGNTKNLNLGHLMGDLDGESLMSQNLWRKVRTIIQTSN